MLESAATVHVLATPSRISAGSGAPFHCQAPMRLVSEPVAPGSALGRGLLEWRCACGLRMDAGMIPLAFTGQTSVLEASAA
ncbi:hypothetical protein [Sinomonas flava]|uniref:DUF2797 domain-containing protein n=1 Tax=Sinomonas flava TaxID=496857 RepID=A0ABP5NGA5_9MICC